MPQPEPEVPAKDLGAAKRKKKRSVTLRKEKAGVSGDVKDQSTQPVKVEAKDLQLDELIRSLTFKVSTSQSKAKLDADQEAQLEREAPELAGAFRNLSSRLTDLCAGSIADASKQVASPDFAIDDGMPLMKVKLQLLISYLTNLSYYILLKTQGVAVSDHPVIPQLVWLRTLQEKIRPLEQRLQYQMQKLLELGEKPLASDDPKNFRPGQLVASVEEEPGDEDDVEAAGNAEDDVYKPPKVAEVEYTGDHVSAVERAEKSLEKARKRLENSEMMRSLREEFTDAPTEIQGKVQSKEQIRIRKKMEQIAEYEEDNMVRVRMSKQERKDVQRVMKEKYGSTTSSLDDAFDFSSLASEIESTRGNLGRRSGGGSSRRLGSALQGYRASTEKVQSLKRAAVLAREGGGDEGSQANQKKKQKKTRM
eukprot:gnl/MRDRNA2_/MRDRNA2_90553_c0_seq1.p1 gnl/MRDRNA2_/MRDRNA2_90553_c0~~gnl/MRDRNA2_/MRDRNA2_90553_c0_seq1.p1  ORF type:complete len:421 (+),score=117.66 gnl/MRDRNA2_/MRDRNA2_90553_c0_seq1:74-1336(+)